MVIAFELPGCSKEHVHVEIEDQTVLVEVTEHKRSFQDETFKFENEIELGERSIREEIHSKYENGVLFVTIPLKSIFRKTVEVQ